MNFKGRKVTVMGLGVFGGGIGVARFLVREGALVTVTDTLPPERLAESIKKAGTGVTYNLGKHIAEDFSQADLVIVNPAVKPGNEFVELALKNGVPVETELNIFIDRCPAKIIGVTGSVGKTTTTMMIYHVLKGKGTWLGGNIGASLLGELDKIAPTDTVVLEISSAQLDRMRPGSRMPDISVVTNISPNHIDWHGTFEKYWLAKKKIVAGQTSNSVAVLNLDDEIVSRWQSDTPARKIYFSMSQECDGVFVRGGELIARIGGTETALFGASDMKLPGAHNFANASAAAAACLAAGASIEQVRRLTTFEGAEHRLEFVREVRGVRYYNDSKATTPGSTLAAMRSFSCPVVLMLGGRDKGMEFTELAREASKCSAVVVFGETAKMFDELIAKESPSVKRIHAKSFEEAIRAASESAPPGSVVLFSPACTSYDMFRNYEERGKSFKDAVAAL